MKNLKLLLLMLTTFFMVGNISQVNAKEKVNVYLFYGDGCPHCEHADEFLNNIEEDYKEKFNLVKYETWYNEENAVLMEAVAAKLDVAAEGVPFIVIGDKSLGGYSEEYNDQIRDMIVKAYDNQIDIMDNIDVKGNISGESKKSETNTTETNKYLVFASLLIILVGSAGLVLYAKKSVN